MFRRVITPFIKFILALAAILILPTENTRWTKGWLFILIFLVMMILASVYLSRTNPEIFAARRRIHPGTKRWDKVLLRFLFASFLSIFVVAALDDGRFHWSSVPLWIVVFGYVLLVVGMVGSVWVQSVNKFAEPGVRIQIDREQRVIDTGPYAIVRHPLYVAAFFFIFGCALALGSLWALIPAAVAILILIVRTGLEDRTLQNELDGYSGYAAQVRYRLIPGIW